MNDGMKKAKREGLRKRETKDRVMYVSAGESSLGERVCVCEVERAGHVYTCICCHMCYKKEKEKRKGQSQWRCLYVNKASGSPFHKGEREREREREREKEEQRLREAVSQLPPENESESECNCNCCCSCCWC